MNILKVRIHKKISLVISTYTFFNLITILEYENSTSNFVPYMYSKYATWKQEVIPDEQWFNESMGSKSNGYKYKIFRFDEL